MTTPALLTAKEAQAYLRCGRTYLWMHADDIGVIRRGGKSLYKLADLDRWNARHYQPPAGSKPAPAPRKAARPTLLPDRRNPVTGDTYGQVAS